MSKKHDAARAHLRLVYTAPAPQEREVILPFWARMPFAVLDFWLSLGVREDNKSRARS
jgi:hypothetical protein